MNHLGLHIIGGWSGNLGRCRLVKLVNCSVAYVTQVRAQVGPECLIIIRFEFDEPSLDRSPEQAARDWYARRRGEMLAMKAAAGPNIAFESACNEVPSGNLPQYVRFSLVLVPLMHADGLRVVWGNCSVGEWHEGAWPQAAPVLAQLQPGDWLGVHEYWPDSAGLENRWWVARWTKPPIAAVIGKAPIVVTECGRDIIKDQKDGQEVWLGQPGWKKSCDGATFLGDLRRYNQILQQYPQVLGATVFSAGGWWGDYDPSAVWPAVVAGYSNPQSYPGVSVPVTPPQPTLVWPQVAAPGVVYKTPPLAPKMYRSERYVPLLMEGGKRRLRLVLHGTEGLRDAAFAWWTSPNNPGKSSAHDLIDREGTVWRCVPYAQAAHHCGGAAMQGVPAGSTAGLSNTNHVSIGIELECAAEPAAPGYTQIQLDAAVAHVRALVREYGIARADCFTHAAIDLASRRDPRAFDWEGFMSRVFGVQRLPDEKVLGDWLQRFVIPQNAGAAFYRYGRARGWEPISQERDYDGFRAQVWYSPGDRMQHVVWARIGEWDKINHFDRAN